MCKQPSIARQLLSNFRRRLATGQPVAFEEAFDGVDIPPGIDRRCYGTIPTQLARNGEIQQFGFRVSQNPLHHNGIKRLWERGPNFRRSKKNRQSGNSGGSAESNQSKKRGESNE
ncbi:MAG: hypothetical protein KDB27_12050 [Planctomycetales bacterium]|nr:hypothetical protein [Planctomycetales bacterium]